MIRRTHTLALLFAGALLVATTPAVAGTFTSPGGPIPDNQPGNPLVVTFNSTDVGPILDLNLVLEQLTHTWAGDIIATLTAPGGATADIMRRPEDTAGFVSTGDSSNFNGTYRFIDGGAALDVGLAGGGSTFDLPSGDYGASTRTSTTTGNVPVSLVTAFSGVEAFGTWTLTVSDNAGLDLGALGSATLNLRVIPEPATLSVLGLGLVCLALARRR